MEDKAILTNSQVTLFRQKDDKIRYYSFKIYPTLFNDFMLIREYGSMKNKKPTGIIKEYFIHLEDAILKLKQILRLKIQKGYSMDNNSCQAPCKSA